MKWSSQRLLLCIVCLSLCVLAADSMAVEQHCSNGAKAAVDMPISLSLGTVRTPEFPVKRKTYWIEIRAQWNLPTDELKCRMGFELSPGYPQCRLESLIEADWTVWDGDRAVARGSDKTKSGDFEAGACYLGRFMGKFEGESKHKYVVEIKFTKDGTPLNLTNPRLIVDLDNPYAF